MSTNKIFLALAAISSLYASQAHGNSDRVSALVMECTADQNACEEYLLGVWDSGLMLQDLNHYSTVVFCTKNGPTGTELRSAFQKWASDADPKVLGNSPRVVGAILALKHAFPCGDESRKGE